MAHQQSTLHRGSKANQPNYDTINVDYSTERLANAADSGDDNSVLGTVADDDNGINIELNGSLDTWTTNPLDGAWWSWRLRDILERQVDAFSADAWQAMLQLAFSILPGTSDDTYIILGVCNTEDPTVASQGWGIVVHATGATIEVQGFRMTASTPSIGSGPGSWVATNTRFHCTVQRGVDNTEGVACVSLDDDGGNVQTAVKRGGSAGAVDGDGLHGFLVVGRSNAANASSSTIRFRPWWMISPAPLSGYLPTVD